MFRSVSNLAPTALLIPVMILPLAQASESEIVKYTKNEEIKSMETIVVVASRIEQSVTDIAGSVAVVTSEDIEKNMVNNLEESLRYIPGVSMNGNSRFGASDFNIRGMDGSRIKVLIDGVEQPTSYSSGVSGTVMNVLGKGQGKVEVDTLTAIEINKGSSSSLYGSGALGGSVLMRTKTTDDLLQGESGHLSIDAGYQSRDNSYKSTINAAKKINNNVKGMVIFTHRDGDELEAHSDGDDVIGEKRGKSDPMSYTSNNILSKFDFQPNNEHRFTLIGQYLEENSNGDSLSLEGSSSGFYKYSNYRFEDEQRRARIGIEHDWDAGYSMFDSVKWKANWQMSEAKNTTFDTKTSVIPFLGGFDRERQRNAKDSSLQFDLQLNKFFEISNTNHDFIYGITLVNNEFNLETSNITSKGTIDEGVVEMPPRIDVRKAGIFAQDQMYMMDDRLVLTTGIRYDMFRYNPVEDPRNIDGNLGDYSVHKSDAFTGQLGGIFHLTDVTSVFAKYARSFKAPTPEELYYSFERNPMPSMHVTILANPDLKPEISDSIEAGIRQNYTAMNWELAAYYNDYSDFINDVSWKEKDQSGNSYFYSTNKNIDNARIYGAEFSGDIRIDQLTSLPIGSYIRMGAAWSKGEDKDSGLSIDSISPLTGVLAIGFDRTDGLYGWNTVVKSVASKEGSDWENKDNLSAPGYSVVDITAYVNPIKNLTIRGGIFNLFDKKYFNYNRVKGLESSSVSNLDALTSPGLNFGINTKYIF
ncbi:TonB-dependent hemoglobin/transferrin/lactoferrin family receptor [Photobacterium frigidiphilum]|uniref:TonB-dependent hemoglobin/transferrin/lactoferrin family receptor n=1 Tax=Photobacterium frigidiphilum TaxID=264736 RepID=UPI003D11E4D5